MREARFKKPLTISLPEEVYDAVKKITDDEKISMSAWFRDAAKLKIQADNFRETGGIKNEIT